MVFLVPFDGSPVSEAVLARAVEHGEALGEAVVAVSFVPTGAEYAEHRKWIQPDEAERTFAESGAQLPGGLTDHVRRVARDVDANARISLQIT